jgi:hypothetical protein
VSSSLVGMKAKKLLRIRGPSVLKKKTPRATNIPSAHITSQIPIKNINSSGFTMVAVDEESTVCDRERFICFHLLDPTTNRDYPTKFKPKCRRLYWTRTRASPYPFAGALSNLQLPQSSHSMYFILNLRSLLDFSN